MNGVFVDSDTGVGAVSGALATAFFGSNSSPANYDISRPILVGLVDGALSADKVKVLSKVLNEQLSLGLTI